mgnify:FL=1
MLALLRQVQESALSYAMLIDKSARNNENVAILEKLSELTKQCNTSFDLKEEKWSKMNKKKMHFWPHGFLATLYGFSLDYTLLSL